MLFLFKITKRNCLKRIAIISDTHGFLDNKARKYIEPCDEIWHAGDIGSIELYDELAQIKPIRAVYGNIDNHVIRQVCDETNRFLCEKIDVHIQHIVGYPGRYEKTIQKLLKNSPPNLLIAGHSHILKVIYDNKHQLLFINPGALGKSGFHQVRTMVRLSIDSTDIKDLEVIEIER